MNKLNSKYMNLIVRKQWATAYATPEFITINTCSGFRSSARDPLGEEFFFSWDVSDEVLGAGIVSSLTASRLLEPDQIGMFFDLSFIKENYEKWVEKLIEKYNYKSRRALFKNMKHCMIERVDGVMTIKPTNHEKLEGWGGKGVKHEDYKILDETVQVEEIGRSLRDCFAKCIG
ncbi:contact-dependent growth inhibition system immunity protein [Endozoicomonas acroporae]|uniref:contact-dependent growth inhibition system immunity protein n=1 Tax=Endozoicomonas acroporae TaxID=1701104 RepID=UPI003D7BE81A